MKGKMKKLFALALAAIMVLAMGMTALASGADATDQETPKDMTITIKNPQMVKGDDDVETVATYTAYKIFTATTDGSNVAYKLDSTSAVYDTLSKLDNEDQSAAGIVLTETTASGEYNVEVNSAPKFAAYLKRQNWVGVTGILGIENSNSDGKVTSVTITVPADKNGYYFVNTNSGSLANINTVTGDIEIYDKNEAPDIEKTTTLVSNSVEIGQKIPYTITGTVPSTVGYNKYDYVVTDTMSEGLTFNNDIVVKVGNQVVYGEGAVGEGAAVQVKTSEIGAATFEITFDMTKFATGSNVEISYSATVNEDAIDVDSVTNTAKLKYSNDPDNDESTEESTEKKVTKYTASIIIDKVDADSKSGEDGNVTYSKKLSGAEFVLTKTVSENGQSVTKYYKYTPAQEAEGATPAVEAKVEWVNDLNEATKATTDDNGAAKFDGLQDGQYTLVETKAPAGFNLLTEGVNVTVTGTTDETGEPVKVNLTQVVENQAGTQLPSTGGIGTTIFYVVGGILVVGAGILLITKKRMSKSN